eukprot:TRINITY_DN25492_c0_g1_i2.p2 TRINITY_DN25492_c0_g1~~TRINITY_DN25492_c0_g1_i2.p2  ORF type:complete len:124 (+),score=1.19 TRINITY_DN25492_c0_g1_i2:141-512(+)
MPRRREFGVADQLLGLVIVILVGTVVLKRWWRARALKQAEIRKLLILAAKEAAIAEAESLADYSSFSYSVQTQHCAVCFSPTATRCSRCKAVRYWLVLFFGCLRLLGFLWRRSSFIISFSLKT